MTAMGDGSPLAHSPTLTATPPRDDADRFAAGAKVGEYLIERFIGGGAMGEVYAGKHPVIGKRVAIKVLRNDLAASAEAAERFIREARAVNQIEHENVVDVFAFGRLDDGRLYLVMDLVEGKSLRAALVDGPLDVERALMILDTVANALDAAHARGVVHRDLKPDNIVLSSATPPKVFVLDFGIAKLISTANAGEQTGPGTLTGQGTWLGTPGYMAPEQWSVDGAGPASDRYALGVIAFELLSGALPFSASSVPGMMEQHFRAEVPALSARGAVGLPPALDKVLARALAKEPEARFPTARAFVDALRAAAGTGAGRARGAVTTERASRKLVMPAIAGAAVLGISVIVVVMPRRDRKDIAVQPRVDDPAPGKLAVEILSSPPGAEVKANGQVRGTTPTKIDAAEGETIELTFAKPGYLPQTKSWKVQPGANLVQASLQEVVRFEGVWKLGNGELRELDRTGEQVAVYKRSSAHGGEKTFFKHYTFVGAEQGIAFSAEDEIVDARAPNDPRCHVRVRVEYHYDPATDVLEQRREKVKIGFQDGSCVIASREIEPTTLARVGASVDDVEIPAPVGHLDKPVKRPPAKTVPKQGKARPPQQKPVEVQKKAAQQNAAPPKAKTEPASQLGDVGAQANQPPPSQQSQILPQPQASAPPPNAEQLQQAPKQKK
jgi:tRNA A-37 threonylcarbamoyl transferase component Bud32